MPPPSPTCWILSDGTTGMEVQATGLAEAMGLTFEVKSIRPNPLLRALPGLARLPGIPATGGARLAPPWPDVAITCGRRHAGASIALKRLSGGATFTIHIQDPRLSPTLFDALVIPEHDPTRGASVVTTTGSLNHITDPRLEAAAAAFANSAAPLPKPRVAVNIGGDTKQHTVDQAEANRIAEQIQRLAAEGGCGLMITTSRRTGPVLTAALEPLGALDNVVLWTGDGPNPYLGFLGLADAVLVTTDSINMVSEACSTGMPVHLLELGPSPARRASFIEDVTRRGLARPFEGTIEDWSPTPLRETERVAGLLVARLRELGILR